MVAGLSMLVSCARAGTDRSLPGRDGGTALCGNGKVESPEECDDGNRLDGDGCSPDCAIEAGWICDGEPSRCTSLCGNGVRDPGEECDGQDLGGQDCTTAGDFTSGELACGPSCRFDTTGCRTPGCGNGRLDSGEECDDGNQSNTDDCLNNCREATCGDGYLWVGHEDCDDGNTSNRDGCLADCTQAACGDGFIWAGRESCDDGNRFPGDGCDASCAVEPGWRCSGEPSACVQLCGNGVQDPGEECDDGNHTAGDGCSPDCRDEHLPVLYWATGDPAVWGQKTITYVNDPHAPTERILAAANADQRGYAYFFTASSYHELSLPDHQWIAHGPLASRFPQLPGNHTLGAVGISWPHESSTTIGIVTWDGVGPPMLYVYREDNVSGSVTQDASSPWEMDFSYDPNAPDPRSTQALFQTLSNANGWTDTDVYALCSESHPETPQDAQIGPYLGVLTTSGDLYLQDSGHCWLFYDHMPLGQFAPFTVQEAPGPSDVVAMFYTTAHGNRLYVVLQR